MPGGKNEFGGICGVDDVAPYTCTFARGTEVTGRYTGLVITASVAFGTRFGLTGVTGTLWSDEKDEDEEEAKGGFLIESSGG
jgi:hypothetical protein